MLVEFVNKRLLCSISETQIALEDDAQQQKSLTHLQPYQNDEVDKQPPSNGQELMP
jgi:hypothetical protein